MRRSVDEIRCRARTLRDGVRAASRRLSDGVVVLATAVVVYENGALLANRALEAAEVSVRLPVGSVIGGLFNVFPVFTHFEPLRYETTLEGQPADGSADPLFCTIVASGDDLWAEDHSSHRAAGFAGSGLSALARSDPRSSAPSAAFLSLAASRRERRRGPRRVGTSSSAVV